MPRITVQSVTCPCCGAEEMHPDGKQLLIRGFKVYDDGHWWSQCLVCAGYYMNGVFVEAAGDPNKGWF